MDWWVASQVVGREALNSVRLGGFSFPQRQPTEHEDSLAAAPQPIVQG